MNPYLVEITKTVKRDLLRRIAKHKDGDDLVVRMFGENWKEMRLSDTVAKIDDSIFRTDIEKLDKISKGIKSGKYESEILTENGKIFLTSKAKKFF